jgi:hypothetical protein
MLSTGSTRKQAHDALRHPRVISSIGRLLDAYVEERVKTTVDLDPHRDASNLEEFALDDKRTLKPA